MLKLIFAATGLLIHVPLAIVNCKKVPDDLVHIFEDWKEIVTDPFRTERKVEKAKNEHGDLMRRKFELFVKRWKNGRYYWSGRKLGKAFKPIFEVELDSYSLKSQEQACKDVMYTVFEDAASILGNLYDGESFEKATEDAKEVYENVKDDIWICLNKN